jgi:hypothetical protein
VVGSRIKHGTEKPSVVPSAIELGKLLLVGEVLLRGMNLFQLVGLSGAMLLEGSEPEFNVTMCSSDMTVVISDLSILYTE